MSDGEWQIDRGPSREDVERLMEFFATKGKLPMTGIELIEVERREQKLKHHYTVKSDAENNKNYELSQAAQALIEGDINWMPVYWDQKLCQKMIEKSYKERLIIAGALIAAELDRLNFKK